MMLAFAASLDDDVPAYQPFDKPPAGSPCTRFPHAPVTQKAVSSADLLPDCPDGLLNHLRLTENDGILDDKLRCVTATDAERANIEWNGETQTIETSTDPLAPRGSRTLQQQLCEAT